MAKKKINHLESTAFIFSHMSNSIGMDVISLWASDASKEDRKVIRKGVRAYAKNKSNGKEKSR